jgi:uncharacterized membrane protein
MFNTIKKTVAESCDEYGIGTAILTFILLLGIVFGVLCGVIAIAMMLWNGVLITLFPMIPEVTFWQMWGLWLLFDILIKPSSSSNSDK